MELEKKHPREGNDWKGRVADSAGLRLHPQSLVVEEANQIGWWAGWGQRQLLTLLRPQVGDAGLYTCLAQSPAGEVEKSFRVRVQGRGCRGRQEREAGWGLPERVRLSRPLCCPPRPPTCYWAPRPPPRGRPGSRAAHSGVFGGGRAGT